MAQGLQIWDENGNLIFDSNTFTTEYLGSFETTTSNGSKTLSVANGRTLWISLEIKDIPDVSYTPVFPTVTTSGNTVSWNFGNYTSGTTGVYVVHYGSYSK